jgi:hypothetical protein
VRAPGPVGQDNRALLSRLPALPHDPPSPQPAAAEGGAARAGAGGRPEPEPPVAFRSKDDSDVGWGREADSNDDRLRRDKPPHW